jgi:hypothetical protein
MEWKESAGIFRFSAGEWSVSYLRNTIILLNRGEVRNDWMYLPKMLKSSVEFIL